MARAGRRRWVDWRYEIGVTAVVGPCLDAEVPQCGVATRARSSREPNSHADHDHSPPARYGRSGREGNAPAAPVPRAQEGCGGRVWIGDARNCESAPTALEGGAPRRSEITPESR
ncbi:hypothetical protein ROP_pROB01-03600 (plasmid) [Rhodococcus opacus B4]|uniref:Uncharacterized protein n=1 Tax=Rhodococcus opacus (strain B4) TaxID=632772 RepID=C1BDB5_RHOOB|nr:hypothetical protein ROP_pROB01-03600 [Rhodococcus opacus B4]